jgi:hypothetical protein
MNNPEDIVQMALSAYDKSWNSSSATIGQYRDDFELELRRLLMQAEPQVQLKLKPAGPLKRDGVESVTIRAEPTHTYIINPPNLMGSWNTTTGTRQCPPAIKPEILHG